MTPHTETPVVGRMGRHATHSAPGTRVRAETTPMADLTPKEAAAVVAVLNPIVADAISLFIRTKGFHWHVSGPHFRDYHLLFDEQAEALLESIDPVAERVRKVGGVTIWSLADVTRLTSLDDDEADLSASTMIERLLDANRQMAIRIRAAIEICSSNRDEPTSNLLQEILDATERRIWFLAQIAEPA